MICYCPETSLTYGSNVENGLDGTLTSHIKWVAREWISLWIFSHEIALKLSFTTKKHIEVLLKISHTPAANHRVRYGVRSELCLTLKHNRGVRENIDIFQGKKLIILSIVLPHFPTLCIFLLPIVDLGGIGVQLHETKQFGSVTYEKTSRLRILTYYNNVSIY